VKEGCDKHVLWIDSLHSKVKGFGCYECEAYWTVDEALKVLGAKEIKRGHGTFHITINATS
jgi:hypothetical protein